MTSSDTRRQVRQQSQSQSQRQGRQRKELQGQQQAAQQEERQEELQDATLQQQEERQDTNLRLQKFLARAGVASRRGSEALIVSGRVKINGEVVDKLGTKIDLAHDVVEVDGRVVSSKAFQVTLMLHKPLGYVTTMKDAHAKHIISELVPTAEYPGLFPLGRLDRDTSGLLLFSTDGELGFSVLRPRGHVMKSYIALVEGRPSVRALHTLRTGVLLDDGMTLPAQVEVLRGVQAESAQETLEVPQSIARKHKHPECSVVRIGICEGRNRQVRRMLAAVGLPVRALHRDSFGPITLGDLARGQWRLLSDVEVRELSMSVSEDISQK